MSHTYTPPGNIHMPSNPEHAWQRRYQGHGRGWGVKGMRLDHKYGLRSSAALFRNAAHDHVELSVEISSPHGESKLTMNLDAAQLRDLAQRLLDAAHDLERYPAKSLQELGAES